ncbi:MAG TPA: type II toxin-antitoxin system VapC family toxin [Candidatus Hydrogenedentes bacterium]|nr:type II toxin-antitoxin system VapC family toxin [Candidatus Hydrogenedentota bacterium]
MNLLLDTHAFLWFIEGSSKLSVQSKDLIEDERNAKWLSVASLWEMAIKMSLGRLHVEQPFEQFIPEQLEKNGFSLLPIRINHLATVAVLPFHHRDPFDRLLAAQCLAENFSILSIDAAFERYAVRRLW